MPGGAAQSSPHTYLGKERFKTLLGSVIHTDPGIGYNYLNIFPGFYKKVDSLSSR
jgi:hypothetical protein